LTTPSVSTAYVTTGPTTPFVRGPTGFDCDSDSAREYEYRTTPAGSSVSVTLCFQATSYPGNRKLVSYKADADGVLYGNLPFSSEVTSYTRQRARNFQLPQSDLAAFDKQLWSGRLENLKIGVYAAVIGAVALSLFALVMGWIVRGFAGIPMRRDTRPGAS